MYPNIQPGDILHIRYCDIADVKVGDIAVCRTDFFFAVHRVIETGRKDGQAYIVTRADRNKFNNDPPTFAKEFFGIVAEISCKGSHRSLQQQNHSYLASGYYSACASFLDGQSRLRLHLHKVGALLARHLLGKTILNLWLGYVSKTYAIRVPLNATLGEMVYKPFDVHRFNPDEPLSGKKLKRWILTLHINKGREPAGRVVVVRDSLEKWQIQEVLVRRRYQMTNISTMLVAKAQTLIAVTSA